MFFYLSKTFQFLYSPLTWILLLSFLSIIVKNQRKKKALLLVTFGLIIIFSNSYLATEYIRLLEKKVVNTYDSTIVYDVAIVLGGGMINYDAVKNRIHFQHNTDRYLQALKLLSQNKVRYLVFSGGSGSLVYRNVKEACLLRDFSEHIGVDTSRIMVECLSDNTYENAIYTKKIIDEKFSNGKYLLITSAHHMLRSSAVFRKQGLEFHTFSTNPIAGTKRKDLQFILMPSVSALQTWEIALKETFGLIVYKILGYA